MNEGGQLAKKKQVDTMKPVAFKALSPVVYKEKEIKSVKDKPQKAIDTPGNLQNETGYSYQKSEEPKLVIQEVKLPKLPVDHTAVNNPQPQTKIKKLSSLEKIRDQVALENRLNGNNVKEVNEEELYVAWGFYIEELRKNNNHSAVNNFKSAKLNIVDNNCIEIVTDNNIQQKFIEAERAALIGHLQAHFNNRFLTYRVIVNENEIANKVEERPLTTKEQYLKIIEEYPLVKQLKDRLGLQLDY